MSEIDDRCRLLSSIVGVLVSSIPSWGREKIGPTRRIRTPKKRKNHPQRTNPNSRTSHRAEPSRRPIDELLCACMHARALCAAAAAAVHAFSVNSAELGTSNDSF